MAVVVTEQSIAEWAPNEKVLLDAKSLLRKGALKKLAKNDDGTLAFGHCDGSGSSPYAVSMDLATGTDKPTVRCTCPSRLFPCKHGVALLLAYAQKGALFPVEEPPKDLVQKREKQAQKAAAEKKPAAAAAAPRVNKTALAKKAKEQSDALDTLETFLVDLVSGGLGGLSGKSIEAIEHQAKRMADADMKRTAGVLTRLASYVSGEWLGDEDDDDAPGVRDVARGLGEAQEARIAFTLTQLYTTVRRGKKALEGKFVEEGTTQSEADAQLESILGKAWRLPELREAGYWVKNRRFLELAHERSDDEITQFATAIGFLVDLDDGSVVCEVTSLPFHTLPFTKLRSSRLGTLEIADAALYPGDLVNRRVRWDEKTEGVIRERPREAADYEAVHRHGKPLDPVLRAMRNQLKNPLHPLDAVFLVAAKKFGDVAGELVVEDEAGMRLVLRNMNDGRLPSTDALRHAAAAFGPGTLAVRLYYDLLRRAIYGDPLALFVGDEHLRLRA
ncbi:SWIM zinc finger family protein [Polyangium jinanense]|uniref:SWIM zinc finger family protein n=1 Tax=Polyangium jinanense TaxID=2829994 RepID=A0A9X4AQ38_9BACT|nr:SWIM zinc finger family protein [Polyangium jinanense]MDC3954401.1 SWIM zinc finger family protein [Polyangium jinanense]MDC3980704.1 SWIM zinc finger family protein [Polyangium jinanense]